MQIPSLNGDEFSGKNVESINLDRFYVKVKNDVLNGNLGTNVKDAIHSICVKNFEDKKDKKIQKELTQLLLQKRQTMIRSDIDDYGYYNCKYEANDDDNFRQLYELGTAAAAAAAAAAAIPSPHSLTTVKHDRVTPKETDPKTIIKMNDDKTNLFNQTTSTEELRKLIHVQENIAIHELEREEEQKFRLIDELTELTDTLKQSTQEMNQMLTFQNTQLTAITEHAIENIDEIQTQKMKMKERSKQMTRSFWTQVAGIVWIFFLFALTYIVIRIFPQTKTGPTSPVGPIGMKVNVSANKTDTSSMEDNYTDLIKRRRFRKKHDQNYVVNQKNAESMEEADDNSCKAYSENNDQQTCAESMPTTSELLSGTDITSNAEKSGKDPATLYRADSTSAVTLD